MGECHRLRVGDDHSVCIIDRDVTTIMRARKRRLSGYSDLGLPEG
jgi:hypothetical protein